VEFINSNDFQKSISSISPHYRSGISNLGKEFFTPCLCCCSEYKRAAGYFSSSALITWSKALPRFCAKENINIKLLVSPQLSEDDLNALKSAVVPKEREILLQDLSDQVLLDAIQITKDPSLPESKKNRLKLLSWLVANKHLELRFAFPKHIDQAGIFHEKIGIFEFPWGERIAFTGSANESISGHSNNYESIDVYRSWIAADLERIDHKLLQFNEAWTGDAFGLETLLLSPKALDLVKTYAPKERPITDGEVITTDISIKNDSQWKHQDEAVEKFLNVGNGILEMATGTGKTRTAIKILKQLIDSNKIHGAVITTDGVDLLDQWRREIDSWNLTLPTPFRILRHYDKHHELSEFAFNPTSGIIIISRGALKQLFKLLPKDKRSNLIVIHDEVHGLGAPGNQTNLKGAHPHFCYRLGLSATPEREYDEKGSLFVETEIGPIVFEFGLPEAIERGILCEFDYIPLAYNLTEDDKYRLKKVYAKKAARAQSGNPMSKEELWTEIAKVYKTAEAKPLVFEKFLPEIPDIFQQTIVFVETKEYGSRILSMIHKHTHKYRTYYSDDERSNLVDFAQGKIDCLITCHRISQGIDINNLKNVILFSSSRAKLETIQRIGRCLRFDPKNPDKRARIIDFVRHQDEENDLPNADQERCQWLTETSKISRKE